MLPLLAVAAVTSGVPGRTIASTAGLGQRLFEGAAPLHGRLYTQAEDLPTNVVRCANCHSHGQSAAVDNSNAPRLSSRSLQESRVRRGGPKSRYDANRFCSLLRTGIDPVHIVIDVQMPRYRMSDEECAALWTFLTEPSDGG